MSCLDSFHYHFIVSKEDTKTIQAQKFVQKTSEFVLKFQLSRPSGYSCVTRLLAKELRKRHSSLIETDFLHSAAGCLVHIINKLLHGATASHGIVVSLPILSLSLQVSWNRTRKLPSQVQPRRQPRVQRFLQVHPWCFGPVDVEFSFDLIPVGLKNLLSHCLAVTNLINLWALTIECDANKWIRTTSVKNWNR